MINFKNHILHKNSEARIALRVLDNLPDNVSRTLFIIDDNDSMVGSLTDGDIRRGLLNGLEISHQVKAFMYKTFKFINEGVDNLERIKALRKADLKLIPVLDGSGKISQILDLRKTKTILPASALIMAGGRGERLKPFTDITPKSMLVVGEKPILEHNLDRLISFGISDFFISVKYLKEQIMDYFGDGTSKGINIKYLEESKPLGTLGSLSLIEQIAHEDILVLNSDLLTNVDFEDFYEFYKNESAAMAVVSIPYSVNVPYAVLETKQHEVASFIEKPTYTYYSNGGIYFLKFSLQQYLAKELFYNATDLMHHVISDNSKKLIHYPLLGYWIDIGNHHDYLKAQEDIKHIKF